MYVSYKITLDCFVFIMIGRDFKPFSTSSKCTLVNIQFMSIQIN